MDFLKRRKSTEYLQMLFINFESIWLKNIGLPKSKPDLPTTTLHRWIFFFFSFLLQLLLPYFRFYLFVGSILFPLFLINSPSLPMQYLSLCHYYRLVNTCLHKWMSKSMNEWIHGHIYVTNICHSPTTGQTVCLWRHSSCSQVTHGLVRGETW